MRWKKVSNYLEQTLRGNIDHNVKPAFSLVASFRVQNTSIRTFHNRYPEGVNVTTKHVSLEGQASRVSRCHKRTDKDCVITGPSGVRGFNIRVLACWWKRRINILVYSITHCTQSLLGKTIKGRIICAWSRFKTVNKNMHQKASRPFLLLTMVWFIQQFLIRLSEYFTKKISQNQGFVGV